MALRFSASSAECNHHEFENGPKYSVVELRESSTPVAQTKPSLWKYSIWSYEGAETLPPNQPPPAFLRNYNPPRYTSCDGTMTSNDKEKQDMALTTLPKKKYCRLYRNIRWTWLSVYHRLNLLVVIPIHISHSQSDLSSSGVK